MKVLVKVPCSWRGDDIGDYPSPLVGEGLGRGEPSLHTNSSNPCESTWPEP